MICARRRGLKEIRDGQGCLVNGFRACVSATLHSEMWRKDKSRERVGKKRNKSTEI